jgi:electron transfer flavoprotein beta subunit
VKEINNPRLPSFKGLMKARKKEVITWSCKDVGLKEEDVGLKGSPTQVVKIFSPPSRGKGTIFPEADSESIEKLCKILEEIV